jgi:hypothetical protein
MDKTYDEHLLSIEVLHMASYIWGYLEINRSKAVLFMWQPNAVFFRNERQWNFVFFVRELQKKLKVR